MSDLLSIGLSGVTAFRTALTAVGDNVANAETPGFARRKLVLREAAGGGVGDSASVRFSGVKVAGLARMWEEFQAADARISASLSGRADVREQWLTAVETALGDSERDVGSLLGKFFNAGVALAAKPDDQLGRSAMLYALDEAAATMRSTSVSLERVSAGIQSAAQLETDALNDDLAALTEVNLQIRQAEPGRSSHASLEDERDRLIDSISTKIDINASIADDGTATLTLAQQTGLTLLDPRTRALAVLIPAADGRLSLQLSVAGTQSPLPVSAGRLAGYIDVAASTADKRVSLDALANEFVTAVNDWSAQGLDPSGNPGVPLLAIVGGKAATISLATTDPAAIAAASATAENGNLLDLSLLRGSNGSESRWAAIVAGQAQALSTAHAEAAAAATRRDNAFAAREEISGIDLDREAAELMRYQQAYGASAKIIQVARETIQSILDLF